MDMLEWFDNAVTNAEDRQLPGRHDKPPTGKLRVLKLSLAESTEA